MYHYKNVSIEQFGYVLPENVLSSADIEKQLKPVYERLNLPYGRLELMTGIKERRFWNRGTIPSQVSTIAAERALANSGLQSDDIDVLFHCSVSRDFLEPATATVVHSNLKLPANSTTFDISNACLGFLNGIVMLANMIELGQVKRGLIVSGECAEPLVFNTIEYLLKDKNITRKSIKKHFASLTIASGAVALVMSHSSLSKSGYHLLGGVMRTATQYNYLCRGGNAGGDTGFTDNIQLSMNTDAELLLKYGIELAKETWEETKNELQWTNDTPKRIFCHQVGRAHRKLLYKTLDLDINKDFSTVEFLGNIGSVSLPITFALGLEKIEFNKNDKIALLGIGSGLTSLMLGLECN